jgi:hypothetical protein
MENCCPNCGSPTMFKQVFRLIAQSIIEITYQCGGIIKIMPPLKGYEWKKECDLKTHSQFY